MVKNKWNLFYAFYLCKCHLFWGSNGLVKFQLAWQFLHACWIFLSFLLFVYVCFLSYAVFFHRKKLFLLKQVCCKHDSRMWWYFYFAVTFTCDTCEGVPQMQTLRSPLLRTRAVKESSRLEHSRACFTYWGEFFFYNACLTGSFSFIFPQLHQVLFRLCWEKYQHEHQWQLVVSAYLPTLKLRFQEKTNHQNPEHSKIFRNTSANVSPHSWNKSSYQNSGKITGQPTLCTSLTDSAQLRTLFVDHARLSTSAIISHHYCELQSSCKCHLSRQWCRKTTSHGVLS